jgi:hypothetical protein
MERLKAELTEIFDIRDLGESSYFLGMEIERKLSECAVNSAALSFYAVILCTALMQHIATHAQ